MYMCDNLSTLGAIFQQLPVTSYQRPFGVFRGALPSLKWIFNSRNLVFLQVCL